jgi:N-methylhydantoinase A/oxoprolinase/acetone carboxylase beta subunit
MLAPRYLRKGVRERVLSTGQVRTPLHEDDVRAACETFAAEGVETVAISFVWSVLNPAHERRAAEIVREMMPESILTVGSDLYPQIREYTRTSTAVVNAYLAPVMREYVGAVDSYFRSLGAMQPVRYFQSNGGLAVGQAMTDRSVYAINSGPASAPQAGQYVCSPFKRNNVITVDMGGTSFDITLTKEGLTNLNKNIDFLRYRLGVPMIQVETLGAGGGSIGWIDSLGILQVGPQSAGSQPGPACYGQGGEKPTMSDANLKYNYMATAPARLDSAEAYDRLDKLFKQIEAKGVRQLIDDGFTKKNIVVKRSLEMRYVGQVHECTVDVEMFEIDEKTIGRVKEAFHRRHEQLYTYSERHSTVEVVNIEATLYGLIEKPKLPALKKGAAPERAIKQQRKSLFSANGKSVRTPVYDGALLGAGANIAGPAIIEEVTTTIVIEPEWAATLHASGSYVIVRKDAPRRGKRSSGGKIAA